MGHIVKTPAGTFRANWRDATGRQRAKTFRTKRDASTFLAEVESTLHRGTYVDPHAGRLRFGVFATQWLAGRDVQARTAERTLSMMRAHILPRWRDWPLSKIDHMAVREWATDLGVVLAPTTVRKVLGVFVMVMKTAVRARYIAINPAEGITLPADRADRRRGTIGRAEFFEQLLPAVPPRHRAVVCAAAGAGLRWGECAGLAWGAVDLDGGLLRVVQVAVETPGEVLLRPFPKTRAGRRSVPMPAFLVTALRRHRERLGDEPADRDLVFRSRLGGPLRRSNFRRRVWRPSLVRAGLLGRVEQLGEHKYRAVWPDGAGVEWSAEFTTERDAVAHVAVKAAGGLRFHDLRHSYATWLVSRGVPINDVQQVLGHERASTTLDVYTHRSDGLDSRIRNAFADDPLTEWDEPDTGDGLDEEEDAP